MLLLRCPGGLPDQQSLTPWYPEYRDEFLRLLRFGDHESVDHPVAGAVGEQVTSS